MLDFEIILVSVLRDRIVESLIVFINRAYPCFLYLLLDKI